MYQARNLHLLGRVKQLFPPAGNRIARAIFLLVVIGVCAAIVGLNFIADSSYSTGVGMEVNQALQFSHKHHVNGLGLDCRFCHASVEKSSSAGYPDTFTCMGCHVQIWAGSDFLKPVRESFSRQKRMEWKRVYNLPDHVFFDHGVHIAHGISCSKCHGEVQEMASIVQLHPFRMKDCNACHNAPEKHLDASLIKEHAIHPLPMKDCYLCHR